MAIVNRKTHQRNDLLHSWITRMQPYTLLVEMSYRSFGFLLRATTVLSWGQCPSTKCSWNVSRGLSLVEPGTFQYTTQVKVCKTEGFFFQNNRARLISIRTLWPSSFWSSTGDTSLLLVLAKERWSTCLAQAKQAFAKWYCQPQILEMTGLAGQQLWTFTANSSGWHWWSRGTEVFITDPNLFFDPSLLIVSFNRKPPRRERLS